MRLRVLPLVMLLSLFPCWNAMAQERTLLGEVLVSPMQVDVKGNGAKFSEYRDLRDGVHGYVGLRSEAEKNYLDFRADDIGYGDQSYKLNGGKWGSFSYHLGYDEIPHNSTFGATIHR